jgi:integrase
MGRPRKHVNRSWPPGLYARSRVGKATYYIYRGPAAEKEIYLGMDLQAAIRGVGLVLAKRAVEPVQKVIARIERPTRTLSAHVEWFQTHVLAERRSKRGKPLSDSTLTNTRQQLRIIVAKLGSRDIELIDRRAIAEFLRAFPAQSSNKYRSLLRQLFESARAEGLREDNPVEGTAKREFVVQRQRLPRAAYDAIRAAAEPWFQRALDLAFWSLQRREDLVNMHVDHWADGKLSVRQGKVEGHGTGLLRITPGKNLRKAIIACLNSRDRDAIPPATAPCPYLLHRVPKKRRKVEGREHFGQVAAEMLTREFQDLRDGLRLFDELEMGQRPSFHEIRALGADESRNGGWSDEKVQALLGHTTLDMTRHYLDRHGERWQEVDAA